MKTVKNYIYNLSYKLLAIVLPLFTTPYVSRVLEVDGTGTNSVVVSVANYFVLFGLLGVTDYAVRQVAYVRDNKEELKKTFWEINILRFVTMGIAVAAYLIFVSVGVTSEERILYYCEGFTLLASLIDISWFFMGLEDFKKTTVRNMIVKTVGVILIFLLVKEKSDLWIYELILAASTFVGQFVMWFAVPKEYRKIVFDKTRLKKHFKGTVILWLPSIAIQVYSSLDKIMLGYLTDYTQAGLYDASQKIVKIASTVTTSLSTVLAPKMSNLFINNNEEEFRRTAEKSLNFNSMISIPLCFGIIAIKDTFVPWFYGPGYEPVSNLLLISAWLAITLGWSTIFGFQILVPTNREKKFTISVTTGAVLNLLLNILFIKRFQAAGALIASVVAEYTGMIMMAIFSRKSVELKNCLKKLPVYLISGALMCAAAYYTGTLMGSSLLSIAVQICVGVVLYFGLLLVFRDSMLLEGISVVKGKIKALTGGKN